MTVTLTYFVSNSFTVELIISFGARPATLGMTIFITLPMSLGADAPVSSMAACTSARNSSAGMAWGRNTSNILISASFSSIRSGRLAFFGFFNGFASVLDLFLDQSHHCQVVHWGTLVHLDLFIAASTMLTVSLRTLSPLFMASFIDSVS